MSFQIHCNIILSSTPRSSNWPFPFRFSDQNFVRILISLVHAICHAHHTLLDIIFYCCYSFHGLGPLAFSDSELTYETMAHFSHFGRTVWRSDYCKASTYTGQHNTEKRWHTSMPRAGFEPATPVFERSKTVRPLGPAAFFLINVNCFFCLFVCLFPWHFKIPTVEKSQTEIPEGNNRWRSISLTVLITENMLKGRKH